jgi:hypothetical protein
VKYALQIDFCGKISTVGGFDDADGVKVVNWTLDAVDDTTAAFAHKVIATNKVSAL